MTTQEYAYSCMVFFLLPLEDVTQNLLFYKSLSEVLFGPSLFIRLVLLSDKKCFGTVAVYRYVDYVIVTVVLGAAP